MAAHQLLALSCSLLACALAASTASPLEICPGSGLPPVMLGEPLRFCGQTGMSCCDPVDDDQLMDEFGSMDVPNPRCAASIKLLLCARCVPGLPSSGLNRADEAAAIRRSVPLICAASTMSSSSSVHQGGTNTGSTSSHQENPMCVERISARSFQTMVAHPDGGSDRAFLSTLDGKIWEVRMPRQGSGGALRAHLFAELTHRVYHDGVLGLLSMAFHPDTSTGRFFVSYICDSRSSPACGVGRCSAVATAGDGAPPCRYQLVVAEYSARGGAAAADSSEASAHEVRKIFTVGLPGLHKLYSYQRHGGQIMFRPGFSEGYYLYLVIGRGSGGSSKGELERSLFGKILRFNVGAGGSSRGTTPKAMDVQPEIYATGFNNPSGCSFDADSPWHLLCADVNEQLAEVVYLVKEGAAGYGGRSSSSNATTTVVVSPVVNRGRPMEGRMPSIVGGRVYRGFADPWLNGRYVYWYSSRVWTVRSRTPMRVRCSKKSRLPCGKGGIGGRVLSMGEDNSNDAFFLTDRGVFRVVAPGACAAVTAADRPQPPGANWVLSVLAFAVAFTLYMLWSTATAGGRISILPNFFRDARFFVIDYGRRAE